MMMMGNMGGSGGSMSQGSGGMGMMDMMNMGGSMGGNMSTGQGMNVAGGMNMNPSMNMGSGVSGMAPMNPGATGLVGGFDVNSFLSGIFSFAINIFAVLLVVAIIVGVIVFIKRYLFDGLGVTASAVSPKVRCAECGQILESSWYCCPKCGVTKTTVPTASSTTQTV